jgi:hypothetical protein
MLIKNIEPPKTYSSKRKKGVDFRSTFLSERFLTMVLKVISNPEFTKVKKLQNIRSFIDNTPMYLFEKDQTLYALMVTIKCVLRNKLEGASEIEDLVEFCNLELGDQFGDIKDNIIFPTILNATEATEKETKLVTRSCDKFLRYEAILLQKEALSDALSDLGSGNISSLDDILNELRDIISDLNEEFNKTDNNDDELSVFHTSRPDEFKEKFKEAYEYEHSPKMCLHTGLKMFDKMISPRGGFLGGTFNLFMADTNTFKSALLENIKNWIKKYNSDMFKEEFLKTGKRPTILFISLENGSKEDLSRDFSISTKGNMFDVPNFNDAFSLFNESLNDTIIDVTQVNAGDYKVNMSTIKRLVRYLEEDGYFVISIIVDSFDLMSPDEEDIRLRVSDETTLLLNRARRIEKWISDKPYPFITAHQLNRLAAAAISEGRQKGMVDLCKLLDRQHVSGSYDILRRAHFTAYIYTEICKFDNEKYLEIRRDKVRYRSSGPEYEYLVTKLHNGFFIDDDYGTDKESCRTTIMPTEDVFGSTGTVGLRGAASIGNLKNDAISIKPEAKKSVSTGGIKPMFTTAKSNTPEYPIMQINPMFLQPQMFFMPMPIQLGGFKGFTPNDIKKQEKYCFNNQLAVTPFDIVA